MRESIEFGICIVFMERLLIYWYIVGILICLLILSE